MPGAALERALAVRMMIFDVDGVLTDGRLYFSESGAELKAFHTLDGHGMKMLMESGVRLALLTGRSSGAVTHRARNLGIVHVLQGVADKSAGLDELLAQTGLQAGQCGYMGDDVVDLPVMRRCALAVAPHEAPEIVTRQANYVCRSPAGAGAAREACELVMRAQGTLDAALAAWLK
jgi:3-deoxy-D-manno-octulosonate 8-phosphate phosphatase (KDO 8-P phosphatase)